MSWVAVGWWVLVLGGLVGTLLGLTYSPQAAIAAGLVAVIAWVVYGGLTSHFLGLARRVRKHLGLHWKDGELLTHRVPRYARADLQLALNAAREADPGGRVFGVPVGGLVPFHDPDSGESYPGDSLVSLAERNPRPDTLKYARLPRSAGETVKVAENAVYLLALADGNRFAALWVPGRLEVLAPTPEAAQRALDFLLADASRRSVYRGRVVSLREVNANDPDDAGFAVDFHDPPHVARDELVLPDDLMRVLDRNGPGWLTRAEALKAAGLPAKHGVLLFGPPGTGKSLAVRYLLSSAEGLTAVLLTGRQVRLVRESFRLARLLAPAMVVLEDVDLIATDREQSRDTALLHDLMDEMDGLGPRAEVLVVLTTNRPEVIERALAGRPGRVDQAVRFPLPDRELRRRLVALFGRKLDLSGVDVEGLLDRTDGASPAFLAELVRRAVVFAAERGEPTRPTDADFRAATRELVEAGGELTRLLLGFTTTVADR